MTMNTTDHSWIEDLRDCIASGTPAVLVSVAAAKGSVPRAPGTKMIVTADRLLGTIGGGHLEWKATEIARHVLDGADVQALQRFPLGASLGQCCGGMAQLLFEPVTAAAPWLDALMPQCDAPRVIVFFVSDTATTEKLVVNATTSS